MRKLDFFNQAPNFYIFHEKKNQTSFGGFIFILFVIFMFLISLLYLYGYSSNEKFIIEYSKYYSPITSAQRDLLNSDPELNPELNFTFDGTNYVKTNYSSNFAFYYGNGQNLRYNVNHAIFTHKTSEFIVELLYKCTDIIEKKCDLREEDKDFSLYRGNYYNFDFTYPTFVLNHSKAEPFEFGHTLGNNFLFNFDTPISYILQWKVVKYKNEKGIFQFLDSWRGNKNEYVAGYIENLGPSPLPILYRYSYSHMYKVIGRIQLYNMHTEYEEYKRSEIKILSVLAEIGALFTSIRGIISSCFAFYSSYFDGHKIVQKILFKKIKDYHEYKGNKFELSPINEDINASNNIIKDSLTTDLIIDNIKEENIPNFENNTENVNFKKLSCFNYFFSNIYCKKLKFKVQDRIDVSNEIVRTYMSYEYILFNQIMLEHLLMDYKWNDISLKELRNNKLLKKFENLEFGYS